MEARLLAGNLYMKIWCDRKDVRRSKPCSIGRLHQRLKVIRIHMARLSLRLTIGVCTVALLNARQRSGPAEAKAIDNRIKYLGEVPDRERAPVIKDLASEIRPTIEICSTFGV